MISLLNVKTPDPVVVIFRVLGCLLAIPPTTPEIVKLSLAVIVKASVLSFAPLIVPEIIC